MFVLTLVSALGCGLIAGVFFAFSAFVMKALARLPSVQGIAAMQAINVAVLNRWFLGVFFGTASACVLLAVSALLIWQGPGAIYQLIGSALYLVGTMAVTIVFNVPRNEALAAVQAGSADGAIRWSQYVRAWTAWNHVRTAAALAAAASLIMALCYGFQHKRGFCTECGSRISRGENAEDTSAIVGINASRPTPNRHGIP